MTRSPILARAAGTPGPTAAMMPHGSCPPLTGSGAGRGAPPPPPAAFRPAILVEIAAAHPRGLHLDDDLAIARCGIGEFHQLELAIAGKDNPAHLVLLG